MFISQLKRLPQCKPLQAGVTTFHASVPFRLQHFVPNASLEEMAHAALKTEQRVPRRLRRRRRRPYPIPGCNPCLYELLTTAQGELHRLNLIKHDIRN